MASRAMEPAIARFMRLVRDRNGFAEPIVYAEGAGLHDMELTSTKNARLGAVRRAVGAGRATEEGLVVAEGPHLVEEALSGAWRMEQILVTAEARQRHAELVRKADCEVVEVAPRAFASLAATETTQGILALLRPARWEWADLTRGTALV